MKNSLLVVPARFGEPDLLALISHEAKIGEGASERGQSANSADPPHQPTKHRTWVTSSSVPSPYLCCLASDAAIHPASIRPPNVIPGRERERKIQSILSIVARCAAAALAMLARSLPSTCYAPFPVGALLAGFRVKRPFELPSPSLPTSFLGRAAGRGAVDHCRISLPPPPRNLGGNEVLLRPARPGTNLRLFRVARQTWSALLGWEECPSIKGE